MSAAAREAIDYFKQHGVECRLVDGKVRLFGAEKLPPEAISRARELKSDLAAVLAEGANNPDRVSLPEPGTPLAAEVNAAATIATRHKRPRWPNPTPWTDAELRDAQRISDERNIAAKRRGGTDRYCRCQHLASTCWIERGRERWRCEDCGPPDGADANASRRVNIFGFSQRVAKRGHQNEN